MSWMNPLVWVGAMGAYARAHFWAWNISSVWSWIGAFGASFAYPNWARDLVQTWYPIGKEILLTIWEWAWIHGP